MATFLTHLKREAYSAIKGIFSVPEKKAPEAPHKPAPMPRPAPVVAQPAVEVAPVQAQPSPQTRPQGHYLGVTWLGPDLDSLYTWMEAYYWEKMDVADFLEDVQDGDRDPGAITMDLIPRVLQDYAKHFSYLDQVTNRDFTLTSDEKYRCKPSVIQSGSEPTAEVCKRIEEQLRKRISQLRELVVLKDLPLNIRMRLTDILSDEVAYVIWFARWAAA